jgi:hypothetical protein
VWLFSKLELPIPLPIPQTHRFSCSLSFMFALEEFIRNSVELPAQPELKQRSPPGADTSK